MDSAMRDLDRLQETDDAEATGRRLALVSLAGLSTVGVVLALFLQVGSGAAEDADADATDPLSRLDPGSALSPTTVEPEPSAEAPAREPLAVDSLDLTFPDTLRGDDRPEVALALAAASAELHHLDPIPASERSGAPARSQAVLPAALAAGASGALVRVAPHDEMLRQALPSGRTAGASPEGHDGELTLQVISYETPEGANTFAAGLRARGHRAFVQRAEVPDRGTMFRVRIGPFETMAEASAYRSEFERTERMNTFIVRRRS